MALQYGTSLDMETIDENSESIYFVKPPNSQQTEQMYEAHSEPFMQVDPPNDRQDVNNSEIWDAFIGGAQDLWSDTKKLFTGTPTTTSTPAPGSTNKPDNKDTEIENMSLNNKPANQPPPATTAPAAGSAAQPTAPQSDNEFDQDILNIQQYFQSSDQYLHELMGAERYIGQPNGLLDEQTEELIHCLSEAISKIIGEELDPQTIIDTTLDDVKNAVKTAVEYKRSQPKPTTAKYSLDDVVIKIAKDLLNNSK
jgi:hypothetical protein